MNELKSTIRYLGYRSLPDGGREFDFTCAFGKEKSTRVIVDAPVAFFQGPDQIAIQEAAGICYETLKFRFHAEATTIAPERVDLTAADVARHRPPRKDSAGRR